MKEDLLKIIKHYGVNAQQTQFAEEVFELQEAITHYEIENAWSELLKINVFNSDVAKKEHIAEEIADVMIMLGQFVYYYDINERNINKIADYKIKRQLERIKNEVKE